MWLLWELTEVIPDTEKRCDFYGETPVQFNVYVLCKSDILTKIRKCDCQSVNHSWVKNFV